ncbi:acyltransferase family protein [Dyella telluris]|uniref:Acyltransferase family protein n=1 Tax=Dyella telluris TaxID=2763498 RepID=A0A7G8Q7I0_9GAMM|nr:acyltransferase family protein [Dyella telluris]QNK02738.1 acyltransferase family protein [Dyella telluris]
MTDRNFTVDIARGIGILTVVAGHASSGSALYAFAPYSFHMPLFFFLSGLFFSDSRPEGLQFVWKCAKSLLLYSTGFYLFYALVSKVVVSLGFGAFYDELSIRNLLFNQFLGSGAFKFTAAYWFIPALFSVRLYFAIVHARILGGCLRLAPRREAEWRFILLAIYLALALFAVSASVSMYETQTVSWSKIVPLRFAFALFFYYFGAVFSKYKLDRFVVSVGAIIVMYVVQQQMWASAGNLDFWMQISKYQAPVLPVLSSIIGSIFVYALSGLVKDNASCRVVLSYLGRNALPILLHHIFGFFVVNAMLCAAGVIRIADVTGPYYQWNTVHTWPVYIVVGVFISLVMDRYVTQPIIRVSKIIRPRDSTGEPRASTK